ncbi:hypothetical protein LIT25_22550 [Bacillus sp. F19]|nr:hypothetical protein LIT25_22550 [Bacillus sp. F19]
MVLPSEEDFTSPIGRHVEQYLQGASFDAKAKTKLFRLVWELTMSSFGTRKIPGKSQRLFRSNERKTSGMRSFFFSNANSS